MEVHPLLVILSPRDIPVTTEIFNKITKYDKLWVKYYNNPDAHRIAKKYFIEHKEYTHVSRIPDDIVITEQQIDTLVNDLAKNRHIECISAVGNYNVSDEGERVYGVCINKIPAKRKSERIYNFVKIVDAPKSGIYRVKFSGGYATLFSRRLLEEGIISWDTDLVAKITKHHNVDLLPPYNKEITCCNDVVISHELNEAGVGEYVDFSVVVKHLKYSDLALRHYIGSRDPHIRFERGVN